MWTRAKKSNVAKLGLLLTLGFLVNCQRARLEPQQPVAAPAPQIEQKAPTQAGPAPVTGEPRGHGPRKGPAPKVSSDVICRPADVKANKIIKVLFIVDASGSNFGQSGSTPSDPDKKWRAETLRNFITTYVGKPNFFYGMTVFKGTTAKAKITVNGEPAFSNERAVVADGFKSFLATPDGGNTPYKAALRSAKALIAADLQDHMSENASYAVVMVSDGHATDYKNPHDVIPDASAIMDLAPDRISLNSVYYSAEKIDKSAPQYLKSIAQIGEGAFILANTHEVLKIDDIINLPGTACR